MNWIEFLQIVCVPALGWFFYKLSEHKREIKVLEKDLNDFKVAVAKEYANQLHITRLEAKIDNLHQLIWEMNNNDRKSK